MALDAPDDPPDDSTGEAQQVLPLPDLEAQPPRARRIFCNRNLRFDHIRSVGFDMDYTLAVYRQHAMDEISIAATTAKLVERGYPESLLSMRFEDRFPIRGLLVDTRMGNVIKTDRYRFPKRAFHGTTELRGEQRRRFYSATKRIRPGNQRYHPVDTLYALSEVTVYSAVIDVMEATGEKLDYAQLFADVRSSIDVAHQDGSIKDAIMQRPMDFLHRDPELPATLHKLRSSGKHIFLLTNSGAEYTDRIMQYLFEEHDGRYAGWRSYFDLIVTDARKPRFFKDERPFERADKPDAPVTRFEREVIYQGGNIAEFERQTGFRGEEVLYVGDHIYGDVLRAKKESAWRTLMILQELRDELRAADDYALEITRLRRMERRRYAMLDDMRDAQTALKQVQRKLDPLPESERPTELQAERVRLKKHTERTRQQIRALEQEHKALERQVAHAFHPFWGPVFHAGSELSSFGEQVERYACLYTDRVTNLGRYSPSHYFRGPRHRMAHEG